MAEVIGGATAAGGNDVEQLEQDREFGDKHDGPLKDLKLIGNLAPSVISDRAWSIGRTYL